MSVCPSVGAVSHPSGVAQREVGTDGGTRLLHWLSGSAGGCSELTFSYESKACLGLRFFILCSLVGSAQFRLFYLFFFLLPNTLSYRVEAQNSHMAGPPTRTSILTAVYFRQSWGQERAPQS